MESTQFRDLFNAGFVYKHFLLQFRALFIYVSNFVGGGSAGVNTLYQLSKRNVNAVLLERAQLTAGTTW
jgi:ribulose 1,5-bisphosphate synthetase/thiazole synthase